ncbi:MAG: hypothetical protein AB7K24_06840 [Gemmataceae bacterium]
MRSQLRRWWVTAHLAWIAATMTGCGQPVREDRHINFAQDGSTVGFQHGNDGVFVARKDGQGLFKVFQPGPEVIATSSPLWSPDGRRMIFTTARDADVQPGTALPLLFRNDPAGNIHHRRAVIYTCWLHEPDTR